ncbi:MAG: ankyrin repeat domain-containing protein, partial [Sedimentisphaerales bacterium]
MAMTLTHITDYLLAQSVQIALLVVVVAAVNLALRNKSAHVRYLLWLIVLAKCLVPPFYAMPLAILPPQERVEPAPMSVPAEMLAPQHEADTARLEPSGVRPSASQRPLLPAIQDGGQKIGIREWLGLGWAVGATAFLVFNLLRALRANLWLWRRRRALTSEWQNNVANLFAGYGNKNFPNVWLVEGFSQPFVWGLWRGSIYLPVDFLKINKPEHQRSVLSHELSHVLRFDAVVNILQVIAQGIFWFHPLVWWANRKIRAEREKCCDEMAVARLSTSPRDYSTAILEALAAKHEPTRPVPSLAVAGPVKNIEERIKTMLRPGKKFYKHPSLVTATLTLLTALLAVPTVFVLTTRAGTEGISTPLHQAVIAGDIERAKSLLSDGADVNAKDEKGNTPLHLVAKYGYKKQNIAELLIAHGANVNARNRDDWTPLHFLAWRSYEGYLDIARLLIAAGSDTRARDKDEYTPLHYAAVAGSQSMIELLLAHGSDINSRGCRGRTALHEAVDWPRDAGVKALLANGADINTKDDNGRTALHHALFYGNKDLAELLITKGANVSAGDSYGCTPLHFAALRGMGETVEALLARGADANAKANSGATPLHYAARYGREKVVEILLAKGADINAKTEAGDTPASAALQAHHQRIFDLLTLKGGEMPQTNSLCNVAGTGNLAEAKSLIDKGVDVNAKDWLGWAPLHYAARQNDKDMIQLLVSRGAKVNVHNREGLAPLHLTTDRDCAELLIAQSADVNIKDNDGWVPLLYAARDGRQDIAEILIRAGANVNPSNLGRKPLHWALKKGHTDIVKLLIEKGADVNAEDFHSDLPLHYAIWYKRKEAAALLLDNGANPDSRDMASFTPLHYAAEYGPRDLVELLITKGADINLNNGWDKTALSMAKQEGHDSVVELLKRHGAKE